MLAWAPDDPVPLQNLERAVTRCLADAGTCTRVTTHGSSSALPDRNPDIRLARDARPQPRIQGRGDHSARAHDRHAAAPGHPAQADWADRRPGRLISPILRQLRTAEATPAAVGCRNARSAPLDVDARAMAAQASSAPSLLSR